MGANYSSGPFPMKLLAVFNELTLIKVRSFIIKFAKMRSKQTDIVRRDDMFLSRNEIKWLFRLKTMQVYEMFRRFDHENLGRISVLDLWGSMALSSLDSPDAKVEFCFHLVDDERNGYISRTTLQTLMLCVTRGLARMKGIRPPELKILNKTVSVIAGMAFVNENGAIGLRDVRVCMLTDENCKAYFAGLGSRLTTAVDSGKLVAQRGDILREIAAVTAEIEQVMLELHISKSDQEAYENERGGDAGSLRLVDLEARGGPDRALPSLPNSRRPSREHAAKMPSDEQRLRRLQRARLLSAAQGKKSISDAAVFIDTKARHPGQVGLSVDFDAQAIERKWATFPCTDDGMCELDIDLVEDLFEAAGIVLTDEEAEDCLEKVQPNQLGRRRKEDVIEWYRVKLCTDIPVAVLPLWRRTAGEFLQGLEGLQRAAFELAKELGVQRELMAAITAKKSYSGSGDDETKPSRAAVVSVGEIQGSQRLVAWQRNQLQTLPTNLNWELSFGNPEAVPMPITASVQAEIDALAAAEASKSTSKMGIAIVRSQEAKLDAAKAEAKAQWEEKKWKMKLEIDITVTPPPTSLSERPPFFDSEGVLTRDDIVGLDLLDIFKKTIPATASSPEAETSFGAVAWMIFNMRPYATDKDQLLLISLLKNFFEGIPMDMRSGTYTSVVARGLCKGQEPNRVRVVLLLLLHEEDWFRAWEESLPPALLLSRSVRRLNLSLRCLDTLTDLYKNSLSFESFDDRLFGPQEDELGEEGMNPIRFAKLQRQRQAAVQESIERAFRMSDQELRTLLKERGLSNIGTHDELATRARNAFKRQLQISGFGELSAFGADISKRIYHKFNPPKPAYIDTTTKGAGTSSLSNKKTKISSSAAKNPDAVHQGEEPVTGMTLWQLNDLLSATGCQTVYDNKDYQKLMQEQQLYIDKESRLLCEGITAYYEQYGRLAADSRKLGIGSLSEQLKGEARVFLAYDPVAFLSLLSLLEPHTLLQKPLKMVAGLLGSFSEASIESEFDTIADLFEAGGLKSLATWREYINSPGWLSGAVHKLSAWLADEEDGVLRSLRRGVLDIFGKYHQWAEVLTDFMSSYSPPPFSDDPDVDMVRAETEYFQDRLDEILPPRRDMRQANSVAKVIELRKLAVHLGDVINNVEGKFQLSRDQREELMALRLQYETMAKDTIRTVEQEKELACAHALALYDGIKRCVSGISGCGIGTKDFTARATVEGLDFTDFLPRAVGEPSVPRELQEDKLRRAAQRKDAAFAALERERARKDKSNPDRLAAKQAKAEKALQRRKEEEMKMFTEAFSALASAREDRKSTQELAAMVRQWEKLQLSKSKQPGLSAAVSQNNYACILQEFYGPDHFKGRDAIKMMETAADTVLSIIVAAERELPLSSAQGDGNDEMRIRLNSPLDRSSHVYIHRIGMMEPSPEEMQSLSEGQFRMFALGEEFIIPLITILQNYVTSLRTATNDSKNAITLEECMHVQRLVKALYETLSNKEKDRLKQRLAKSVENIPVFIMGNVEAQLKLTFAVLEAANKEEIEAQEQLEVVVDEDESSARGSDITGRGKAPSPGHAGHTTTGSSAGSPSGTIASDDLLRGMAQLKIERDEKRAKMLEARRAANILRAQTVRRRNRLYHLIKSDEISRIFEIKAAGHVLSDSNQIRWGTDAQSIGDPLAFLDSDAGSGTLASSDEQTMTTMQTMQTLQTTSVLSGDTKKKKKRSGKSKGGGTKGVQFDDESTIREEDGGSVDGSVGSYPSRNMRHDESESEVDKEGQQPKRGKLGLLSWLFRNRDKI